MSFNNYQSPRNRNRSILGKTNRLKYFYCIIHTRDEPFSPTTHRRRYLKPYFDPKLTKPENLKPINNRNDKHIARPLTPPNTKPTFRSKIPIKNELLSKRIYDNLRLHVFEKSSDYAMKIFRLFDTDNNNKLNRKEFIEGLKMLHVKLNDNDTNELMKLIDPNYENDIDYETFINKLRNPYIL